MSVQMMSEDDGLLLKLDDGSAAHARSRKCASPTLCENRHPLSQKAGSGHYALVSRFLFQRGDPLFSATKIYGRSIVLRHPSSRGTLAVSEKGERVAADIS